jgi:large subunit ribosomal protein L7Ae
MPKAAKSKTTSGKAAPYDASDKNPLFEARPRTFRVGHDLQGVKDKLDLTRFVKWPRYVRIQRSKRVLVARLKTPPAINQFTRTLDSSASELMRFWPRSCLLSAWSQRQRRRDLTQ